MFRLARSMTTSFSTMTMTLVCWDYKGNYIGFKFNHMYKLNCVHLESYIHDSINVNVKVAKTFVFIVVIAETSVAEVDNH